MKMRTVNVRNTIIGTGIPKICVPIVAVTKEAVIQQAEKIAGLPADVVEWRADWYEDAFDDDSLRSVLVILREILADMPVLLTFRTEEEGGRKAIGSEEYADLIIRASETGLIDMVDVELFTGDAVLENIISCVHAAGVKVIVSSHDFDKTPAKDEIVSRLRKMQETGADITKIAVMPSCRNDVLTLLAAAQEMTDQYADRPFIAISMSGMGIVSRIAGEIFGSAMTFGAASATSAPGQMAVRELRTILDGIHHTYTGDGDQTD